MTRREELLRRLQKAKDCNDKYHPDVDIQKEAAVYNLLTICDYPTSVRKMDDCSNRFRVSNKAMARMINEANSEFMHLLEKSSIPYILEDIIAQQDRDFQPQYIDTRNRVSEKQERELDKDTKEQRMDDGEEGLRELPETES